MQPSPTPPNARADGRSVAKSKRAVRLLEEAMADNANRVP